MSETALVKDFLDRVAKDVAREIAKERAKGLGLCSILEGATRDILKAERGLLYIRGEPLDTEATLDEVIEYCSAKWESYERTWGVLLVIFLGMSVALVAAAIFSSSYLGILQAAVLPMIYYAAGKKEEYSGKIVALRFIPLLPEEQRVEFLIKIIDNYLFETSGEQAQPQQPAPSKPGTATEG